MKIKVWAFGVVQLLLVVVLIPCFYLDIGEVDLKEVILENPILKEDHLISEIINNDKNIINRHGIVIGRTYLLKNWCVYLFPLIPIYVNGVLKSISGPLFAFFVILLPLDKEYNITAVKTGYYCNTETVILSKEKQYAVISLNLREDLSITSLNPKNI